MVKVKVAFATKGQKVGQVLDMDEDEARTMVRYGRVTYVQDKAAVAAAKPAAVADKAAAKADGK